MGTRSLVAICLVAEVFAAPLITDPGLLTPEFFTVVDKNGDGKIDFEEFLHVNQEYINSMMKEFAKLDKDGSDSLDVKEFTALPQDDKNRYFVDVIDSSNEDEPVIILRETVEKDRKMAGGDQIGASSDSEESLETLLDDSDEDSDSDEKYDEDGNGKLNEDELITYIQDFLEMALKRSAHTIIERYDSNTDGGLDQTELLKFVEELPEDLVEDIAGSEEYDYVHDDDENDYGFAADSIISDRH